MACLPGQQQGHKAEFQASSQSDGSQYQSYELSRQKKENKGHFTILDKGDLVEPRLSLDKTKILTHDMM